MRRESSTGWPASTPPWSGRTSTPPAPATRARAQGARSNDKNLSGIPAGEALGRSRGGLSTKLHLIVDGNGLPLSLVLTAGQAGDNPQLTALLDRIRVPRIGPGRARRRPDHLLADKGYSHPSTRRELRRRGIGHTIPERSDQKAARTAQGPAGGRPPTFRADRYRHRNVVERCFNRLKQWRGIATRYDKKATNYEGGILLAALILWTRN